MVSSTAKTPSDSKKKKNDSSSSEGGGIGKTLTYSAIIIGILAFVFKIVPRVGPKVLQKTGVVSTEKEGQAYFPDLWESFDWDLFYSNLQTHTSTTDWKERPGAKLAAAGASAKYPVVIIPGFTTSGLEVWGNEECGRKYFRTRFWGTMDQAKALIADRDCWRRHMTLHPYNGGDPTANIRLRPTEGMVAGDYFMAPYWVSTNVVLYEKEEKCTVMGLGTPIIVQRSFAHRPPPTR